jgi:hypothetical protein
MHEEKAIDDLIEAGWYVLDSNFDETALQNWRDRALICLTKLLGQEHVYTRQFSDWVEHRERLNLMAAGGVLVAAKEIVLKTVSASGDTHLH